MFLHGVETIEVQTGARPIQVVKTAVIGLVGTAPVQLVAAPDQTLNTPVLILNERDAAKYFGPSVPGYSIPQALNAIFQQGSGPVVVVNVLNKAANTVALANQSVTFNSADQIVLPRQGVFDFVLYRIVNTVETPYLLGSDYLINQATGVITRITTGVIPPLANVISAYKYVNTAAVTTADVIGTTTVGGQRTGLQALLDCPALFGFNVKTIIAPAFSTLATVVAAMDSIAGKTRAIALVDAPAGTTVAQAITGRGNAGSINLQTSSYRVVLCYPYVKAFDSGANAEILQPYSQWLAGAWAAKDQAKGYWWSPSNTPLVGVTGMERTLTAGINDSSAEVNQLNAVGITTVYNAYGTGFRTWGNRSAAWPTYTDPANFVNIRRIADVVEESIEGAMLQFVDFPVNNAFVDSVLDTVNSFIRTQIGRGALLPGSRCYYDASANPATELALGHITFNTDFMGPPPAERITFQTFVDISLLNNIAA